VRRTAHALLVLSLLAAACSEPVETFPCPGSPVARLAFSGPRTAVTCAGGAPAAGVNSLYPAEVRFTGTLTSSASGAGAALCLANPRAEPLLGTRVADHFEVALETRGALLGGCGASCAVTVLQRVSGSLERGPGGTPTGFTGTLVDQATVDLTVPGAHCSECTTPCQAVYTLSAVPG
jgi:hypothetical protein